ncbi:MAG TPA: VWA domain-containing protein [Myxococcota bacterium]|nr:VWA domain-containing protein [Myxococcota bacterium]
MFLRFLYALRAEGLPVGTHVWLALMEALRAGLIADVDSLYAVGRAIVCRTEADYDPWDLAFSATFGAGTISPEVRAALAEWLEAALAGDGPRVDPAWSDEDLWKELLKRLEEQKGRHDGGSYWVGTGGTSPFGNSGRAARGIRVGGASGGRSAIAVADQRQWEGYRTDQALDARDYRVALKALRRLVREGRYELDLDATIDHTARNAGEIDIVERRERENQVRVVLLMDAGGSMAPHARRVEELFTAAEETRTFRSFESYFFHNCVYGSVWSDLDDNVRVGTGDLLAKLTPRHRVVFVGDASMAPYELFSAVGWGWSEQDRVPGVEWLKRFKQTCPASVWLNPDPKTWWDHPTVSAIGQIFPMFELTIDGLREAITKLRAPT